MLSAKGTVLFGGGKVVIGYVREAVQARNPKQQL
nr:MAG TPA: hypothetical protein [Caudoviricetes sp.]